MNQVIRSFVRVRDDADHHVRAWKAWNTAQRPDITPLNYLRAMSFLRGVTVHDIWAYDYGICMTEIRFDLVKAVKGRFPDMSLRKIASLFKRDHKAIVGALRAQSGVARRGAKLSLADAKKIRSIYARGRTNARILAEKFGVSHGTVSAIIRGEIYRGAI